MALPQSDRDQILYYLRRHERMHNPNLLRLFYTTAIDSRSRRADVWSREYIGYTQANQGTVNDDFYSILFSDPLFGQNYDPLIATLVEEDEIKSVISAVNKLRPK